MEMELENTHYRLAGKTVQNKQGKVSSERPCNKKTKPNKQKKTCNQVFHYCPDPEYKDLKNRGCKGVRLFTKLPRFLEDQRG